MKNTLFPSSSEITTVAGDVDVDVDANAEVKVEMGLGLDIKLEVDWLSG